MLWALFIKVYAVVGVVYLAVVGTYIGWRTWQNKRNSQSAHR